MSRDEKLLRREEWKLEILDAVVAEMNQQHVTRAELAKRLNVTPGMVTQFLTRGRNLTSKTVADICGALGRKPRLVLELKDEQGHVVKRRCRWRWTPGVLPPLNEPEQPAGRCALAADHEGPHHCAAKD